MIELAIAVITIITGLIFGRIHEARHFKALAIFEHELSDIVTTNLKTSINGGGLHATLVSGSVVIANDAFKKFISGFMLFFGGRVSVYETLMERARREAIIRMKEQARSLGALHVINVRIETATIKGKAPQSVGSIEMLAYGTALYR